MKMGLLIGATILILALGFLAIGSAHRDRCIRASEIGCTLLPWSGHEPSGWGFGQTVIP
jgi:mannose/fructose/N-acetylgalactosamine-specific phosphotransferase system component IIC